MLASTSLESNHRGIETREMGTGPREMMSLNRTIVELKPRSGTTLFRSSACLNRTIVELKPLFVATRPAVRERLNRTIVELKLDRIRLVGAHDKA